MSDISTSSESLDHGESLAPSSQLNLATIASVSSESGTIVAPLATVSGTSYSSSESLDDLDESLTPSPELLASGTIVAPLATVSGTSLSVLCSGLVESCLDTDGSLGPLDKRASGIKFLWDSVTS